MAALSKSYKSKYRWKNNGAGQGIPMHTVIAERVLGKKMPPFAEIHHVDGNGLNNSPDNLVICPDHAYHMLLHMRQKAENACGNPNWMRCIRCKQWDDPVNMHVYTPKDQTSGRAQHRACQAIYEKKRRVKN